jgi:hypothetical protein
LCPKKWAQYNVLNPNTCTCPLFRTKADVDLSIKIYKSIPILINEIRKILEHIGLWTETRYRASPPPNQDSQEEAEVVYEPFDDGWPRLAWRMK